LKPTDQAGIWGSSHESSLISGKTEIFNSMLDQACGRLETAQNQGITRRIAKMEETLQGLEDELNEILEIQRECTES
jgi:predicted ribosome quality control (RQC) complex YloA/Tae2 family protein